MIQFVYVTGFATRPHIGRVQFVTDVFATEKQAQISCATYNEAHPNDIIEKIYEEQIIVQEDW